MVTVRPVGIEAPVKGFHTKLACAEKIPTGPLTGINKVKAGSAAPPVLVEIQDEPFPPAALTYEPRPISTEPARSENDSDSEVPGKRSPYEVLL